MRKPDNLADVMKNNGGSEKGIRFIHGAAKEEFLSYSSLYEQALGVLGFLQAAGIKQGEEMLFQVEQNMEFILLFWACILGGIIPVPVTTGNNDEYRSKVIKIWKILNSPHLACSAAHMEALRLSAELSKESKLAEELGQKTIITGSLGMNLIAGAVTAKPRPEDIAFIQFSSGSTGDPKGVILTHKNLMSNIEMIHRGSGAGENDSYLCWMPLTHDLGLIGCHLNPLVNDINQFNMQTSLFIRRPELWMQKTHEHRVTMLQSPNFGFNYFLENHEPQVGKKWDLSCVRVMYNGAEPISAALCDKFLRTMEPYGMKHSVMYPVYGLAEASVAVSFPPPGEDFIRVNLDRSFLSEGDEVKPGQGSGNSVTFVETGFPLDGCCVRIYSKGEIMEDGRVGRIQIKGDNVTSGYYNNHEATQKIITSDGWLDTGDLGFMRSGRLTVTGRIKDIVFINGQNFYPHDIERTAEQVEGVDMGAAAACGVFNEKLQSEELAVFIVSKKEPEEFAGLAKRIKGHINRQTGIQAGGIIPVKKLPKTTSGKLQRFKLRQMFSEGAFNELYEKMQKLTAADAEKTAAGVRGSLLEEDICAIFGQVLGTAAVNLDDNFFDMGAGSLQLAMAAEKLEKKYPGRVSVTDMFRHPSVKRLAGFMQEEKSVSIPAVLFPDDFYPEARTRAERSGINFRLNSVLCEKLGDLASEENIFVNDVLLAVYLYMISKVSVHGSAVIHVMTEDGSGVISISLNMDGARDFTDLLKAAVAGKTNMPVIRSPEELDRACLNKGEGVRLFFGCVHERWSRLRDIFDVVFETPEEDSTGEFTVRFDCGRLRKDKILGVIDGFTGMLAAAADRYGRQAAGAGR